MSSQMDAWNVANSEVVSQKSKDGRIIEGVLHKPEDYDASKKYPLMVIIQGVPTGISMPMPTHSHVYPIVQQFIKQIEANPKFLGKI